MSEESEKALVDALLAKTHERWCKWFDDDGWNSGTLANFVRSYNCYPPCTCAARPDPKGGAK